ncbi:MAG: SUMF1/EgtB/PvdO family nonheme iron enzyme [Saprospiraceae bacterium]
MKTTLIFFLTALTANALSASNIRVSGVEVENASDTARGLSVKFTLAWDNAWRNERNHDAAWVFLKFKPNDPDWNSRHAKLRPAGHTILGKSPASLPDPTIEVSDDRVGAFIYPSARHRGAVQWTLRLFFDKQSLGNMDLWDGQWSLHAIEMVLVPAGGFTLGDPDTTALRAASFFKSGADGQYAGLFALSAENQAIEVGNSLGQLNYRASEPAYQGDQKGPVPPSFPKGVAAFYVQKYEITQGEYATFLNALGTQGSAFRANFGSKKYARSRGSIGLEGEQYIARSPARPLNFVSWDDGCAFADWAGLRPMTELEFEKAARGPAQPVPHEYPWGSGDKNRLARYVDLDDELKNAPGLDESQLTDATRDVFGASHFWVMDLAGSLWERVVSIGHPTGRAFRGSHGDGRVDGYGQATNPDWPKGSDESTGGFGYRGGGYYEHGKAAGDFNPHSPIGWRNFAAWAGGPRSIAYGFRCVRTAGGNPASPSATGAKTPEAIIRERIADFSKQVMAANWDGVAEAYTPDAKILPPGQPTIEGRADIRKFWSGSSKVLHHKITPSEIEIIGSKAYDWGIYEGRSIGADGKESVWRGKYVIVWKEVVPGDWRIYLDIWNRLPE